MRYINSLFKFLKIGSYAVFAPLLLASCIGTSIPLTKQEVSDSIEVKTGSRECPRCSKVVTYKSNKLAKLYYHPSFSDPDWMSGDFWLEMSNRASDDNKQTYRLSVRLASTSGYNPKEGISIISPQNAIIKLKSYGVTDNGSGSIGGASVGFSCYWYESFEIPNKYIDDALSNGSDIQLSVLNRVKTLRGNDGYKPTITTSSESGYVTIKAFMIAGFVEGLKKRGVELPK